MIYTLCLYIYTHQTVWMTLTIISLSHYSSVPSSRRPFQVPGKIFAPFYKSAKPRGYIRTHTVVCSSYIYFHTAKNEWCARKKKEAKNTLVRDSCNTGTRLEKKKRKAMWEAPHNDRTKWDNDTRGARASITAWKSVLGQTHKIQRIF